MCLRPHPNTSLAALHPVLSMCITMRTTVKFIPSACVYTCMPNACIQYTIVCHNHLNLSLWRMLINTLQKSLYHFSRNTVCYTPCNGLSWMYRCAYEQVWTCWFYTMMFVCLYLFRIYLVQCMLQAGNGKHWYRELRWCRDFCGHTFGTDPVESVFEWQVQILLWVKWGMSHSFHPVVWTAVLDWIPLVVAQWPVVIRT